MYLRRTNDCAAECPLGDYATDGTKGVGGFCSQCHENCAWACHCGKMRCYDIYIYVFTQCMWHQDLSPESFVYTVITPL